MNTQHKPEPWPEFNDRADGLEYGKNNERIYSVSLYEHDYNRARSCVNACDGLTEADIATITEHGGVVELYNALPDLVATVHRLRDVEQQRDELHDNHIELIETLRASLDHGACSQEWMNHINSIIDDAEAIAKHRGQQS